MAMETLIEGVPIPAENVHAMPTIRRSPKAAEAYEAELRGFFGAGCSRV